MSTRAACLPASKGRVPTGTPMPPALPSFKGRLVARDPTRVAAVAAFVRETLASAEEDATGAGARAATTADTPGAAAACAVCGGHCCRKGGDSGYLDADDFVRIRRTFPRLTCQELEAAYVAAVADETYEGSCIFHAAGGCSLPRAMRSRVCIAYLCGPLQAAMATGVSLVPAPPSRRQNRPAAASRARS